MVGQSRRRGGSRSMPSTPGPSQLAKLSISQPAITLDTGTPIRPGYSRHRNSSSSSRKALSRDSRESLRHTTVLEEDDEPLINGPRPSIDDDNGEGDPDLTSPVGGRDLIDISGSDDDEDEHDTTPNALPGPLARSRSTPLLIPAPPNAFAPPFYNRPPTPLPPSPSLTSLLRPSFSSRPTTPDESESENAATATAGEGSATEAAVAKSARDARTVPRASPKVPTYEYYGFVLYVTSGLCFLLYVLWSYLPSPFLHQLGIYYYPNRWWSLAVPAFLVMSLLYIYVALAAYNTEYLTPPMGSVTTLVDEAANIAALQVRGQSGKGATGSAGKKAVKVKASVRSIVDHGPQFIVEKDEPVDWAGMWNQGTDAVMDVPIGGVCELLYGDHQSL